MVWMEWMCTKWWSKMHAHSFASSLVSFVRSFVRPFRLSISIAIVQFDDLMFINIIWCAFKMEIRNICDVRIFSMATVATWLLFLPHPLQKQRSNEQLFCIECPFRCCLQRLRRLRDFLFSVHCSIRSFVRSFYQVDSQHGMQFLLACPPARKRREWTENNNKNNKQQKKSTTHHKFNDFMIMIMSHHTRMWLKRH